MNAGSGPVLYTPGILALAVELAAYPFDPAAPFQGMARSRTCGSSINLSSTPGGLGLKVTACAIGQASAAIFARHFPGKSVDEIARSLIQIEVWLSGSEIRPEWPDIEMLDAAREYPARHGAILLPWKAALDALSKAEDGR